MKHITITKFSKSRELTQDDLDFLNKQIAKHPDEKQVMVSLSLERPRTAKKTAEKKSTGAKLVALSEVDSESECKGTKGPCQGEGIEYNCNGVIYCKP